MIQIFNIFYISGKGKKNTQSAEKNRRQKSVVFLSAIEKYIIDYPQGEVTSIRGFSQNKTHCMLSKIVFVFVLSFWYINCFRFFFFLSECGDKNSVSSKKKKKRIFEYFVFLSFQNKGYIKMVLVVW